MKKGRIATAGMVSLAMLLGAPAWNVLAAEPSAVVQPQADTMTRGEFFKLLDQAVDLPAAGTPRTYKDVAQGSEWFQVVNKLRESGALHGYGDGTVRPERELKASEAIALLGGVLGIPNQSAPGSVSPLPAGHWAHHIAAWMNSAKVEYKWDNLNRTLTKQEAQALIKQMLTTSESAKKLLEESQNAQRNVQSFRMQGAMSFSAVLKEGAFANMSAGDKEMAKAMADKGMSIKMEGAFMMPDSMYMKTIMNTLSPLQGAGEINVEQYIIGKDIYMKMPEGMQTTPDNPKGWVKMKNAFPMDMKAMMEQQMSGIPPQLEKKLFYRDLGNGQLAFQGRIDKLTDLAPMLSGVQGMDDVVASLEEAGKVIRSVYMQGTMTLDPQTKLAKDAKMQVVVTFNGSVNGEEMPFKQIALTQEITYSGYNGDVKVELPEAAKKAQEMPATPDGIQAFAEPEKK